MCTKALADYVDELGSMGDFSPDNIVVEHRNNNSKRDYLFVNKVQCKHIPCTPGRMLDMITKLSDIVGSGISDRKSILVIAFAETATAIGNALADRLLMCSAVMQTTRESIPGTHSILTFEEEHSHATTHRLLWPDNAESFNPEVYDYILFVDDEVTTGNTILNFVNAYKKAYCSNAKFGVASICNWQDREHREIFRANGIDIFSLLNGFIHDATAVMSGCESLRTSMFCEKLHTPLAAINLTIDTQNHNERLIHRPARDFRPEFDAIFNCMNLDSVTSIRVIGTEEFMYVPVHFAEYLSQKRFDVVCQATTRSDIDVTAPVCDTGIKSKHLFSSIYDSSRQTYLYNLESYSDVTLVLTDGRITDDIRDQFSSQCNSRIIYFIEMNWRTI